ncbi:Transcription initiation factor TFIID subunit 12 [Microbotryomycetes sp. JL201]|nr:Transcription initiation factor TFIID subunit 12 [Microbotryomycetes sp. JL201]
MAGGSQLTPQQVSAVQEHMRHVRQVTGQDITQQALQQWMAANGMANAIQPGQPQQQQLGQAGDAGQQAAMMAARQAQFQQQQQQNPNLEAQIINHLFPPQLAGNQQAAVAHLISTLFPQNGGAGSSQLLQQVMALAQNGRLSSEQMAQLKGAVAVRNANQQNQQNQQSQQNQQGQQFQQQQQPGGVQQAPQMMPQSQVPQQQPMGQQQQQTATQAVQQLQSRINSLQTLLTRPDLTDEQRAQMQKEMDSARTQMQRVVKLMIAAQQSAQNGGNAGGDGQNAAGGAGVSLQSLQEAQRVAMERRAMAVQQASGQYRTASPSQAGNLQLPGAAGQQIRNSPSMNAANLPNPGVPAGMTDPKMAAALQQKAQQAAQAHLRAAQAASTGAPQTAAQKQAQALAQQQALAQAKQAHLQQAQANAGQGGPTPGQFPASSGPTAASAGQPYTSISSSAASAPIPPNLSMPQPSAEAFPSPRPTLSSGLANSPAVSTPAITRPAGMTPQQVADALGRNVVGDASGALGGAGVKREDGAALLKDMREDSRGRTVSKRKIRELVEGVDPEERLSDDVEDLLLEVADEFIDSITRFACQLAKHRKSDRLEVRDLALHLDRAYNIRIPGFLPEETRQVQRRLNLPPGYAGRVAAVRDAGNNIKKR